MSKYILHSLDREQQWLRRKIPSLFNLIDTINLTSAGFIRFASGKFLASNLENCHRPEKLLILYEYEACPFCTKVREVLSVLDIDYFAYPCPRSTVKSMGEVENSRFRLLVKEKGGEVKFPYLEDPNTGASLYESDAIVKYLWTTYGSKAKKTLGYRIANSKIYQMMSLKTIIYFRPCLDMGFVAIPSIQPEKPLELWGYESSPFVKIVREKLCSLEIPYVMHVMGYGSKEKRKEFLEKHRDDISSVRKSLGLVMVPYLEDPNTGVKMFESRDMIEYLKNTYQLKDSCHETWLDYGSVKKPIVKN